MSQPVSALIAAEKNHLVNLVTEIWVMVKSATNHGAKTVDEALKKDISRYAANVFLLY